MRNLCFILFLLGASVSTTHAQIKTTRGVNDTILVSGIVWGTDTIPYVLLSEVYIRDARLDKFKKNYPRYTKKEWKRKRRGMTKYERLRYNVFKTYPYAVQASIVMADIDSAMQVIKSKDSKALYKSKKEEELMKEFKGELENLTMSQGKVLVKLIARQTNKDCYTTIKELKGGFNARVWQTLALLFKNDLKGGYDASGRDKDIEKIVLEIERNPSFKNRRR